MKAVVMAGGEGSRLRPLTANRPKPMVPICNRPIMEHIVELLKRHGFNEIISTLYYQADEIQSYFGNGSDFGVSIRHSVEPTPLGTAGSVKKAENLIGDGTFLIISGDALTDCDLAKALDFHRSKKSLATLILFRVQSPLDFGVVITGDDGRVIRFLEKPSWSEVFSDTVNTGMYILEPEIFQHMDPGKPYDWSGDVFPRLVEERLPIYGYVMDGYWTDIGSLQQYREAQEDMLTGQVRLNVQGESPSGTVLVGPNCVIDESAVLIPPLCIGRNCKIKRGARIGPYSVIGDNCFVEEAANIECSVVWEGAYIGPKVGIHSAIVCSKAVLKRDTVIREDAVIGDRCLIDVGCTIRPRVKIWPDKTVERGSIVTMSLVWGSKWRGSLFRELGVAGLSNVEITPDFACRLGSAYASSFPGGSRIVTSRDSTMSSRMIKRALISSLMSVGCNVMDLRSSPLPVARHFIKTSGAVGAINVRKLPGNTRVSLIEMFDERGAYISRSLERKVESAFFREDFRRADPDDLGQIEFASRAVEQYQDDFFRLLPPQDGPPLRVVCDYGYSAMAAILPNMFSRLGVESISLNGFNDAKLAPRTEEQIGAHVQNLSQIVANLGYDLGVLFTQEGERLTVVDERGRPIIGNALLATMGALLVKAEPNCRIGLSITAPTSLEQSLTKLGAHIVRSRADVRSMMSTSVDEGVRFSGDDNGGFIFPDLHPGFDAAFGLAMLVTLLKRTHLTISQVSDESPVFRLVHEQVRVPWEAKGLVMRRVAEESSADKRIETLDGIKIYERDTWVLILPDSLEPRFHIYAESSDEAESRHLAQSWIQKIEAML